MNVVRPLHRMDPDSGHRLFARFHVGVAHAPAKAIHTHALFGVDGSLLKADTLHLTFRLPFSGWTGGSGNENFVLGNLMAGVRGRWLQTDLLSLHTSGEIYLPTFESPSPGSGPFEDDPRQIVLGHWMERPGLALQGYMSFSTDTALTLRLGRVQIGLEGGALFGVELRRSDWDRDTDLVGFLRYVTDVSVWIVGPWSMTASWVGLVDLSRGGEGVQQLVGLAYPESRWLHGVALAAQFHFDGWFFGVSGTYLLGQDQIDRIDPFFQLRIGLVYF